METLEERKKMILKALGIEPMTARQLSKALSISIIRIKQTLFILRQKEGKVQIVNYDITNVAPIQIYGLFSTGIEPTFPLKRKIKHKDISVKHIYVKKDVVKEVIKENVPEKKCVSPKLGIWNY